MNIVKKIKCVHCQETVEHNGSCSCGKVKMTNGTITEGKLGSDYLDVSAKLLNESY
ncbi:MAG: hypothetical protein ACOC2U_02465 [bacterium]